MRKAMLLLFFVVALVVAALGLTARAQSDGLSFRADLAGLNEVPPTSSRATGSLTGHISADGTSLTFTLTYSGLTASPSVAHIHFGPTKVSGGVMVFFCGGGGKPACPLSTSGTLTGTIMAADIVGPASQGIPPAPNGQFSDVVRAIRSGNGYANMHTANFPAGEIRGQLQVED